VIAVVLTRGRKTFAPFLLTRVSNFRTKTFSSFF
jgi:hypothetical protein